MPHGLGSEFDIRVFRNHHDADVRISILRDAHEPHSVYALDVEFRDEDVEGTGVQAIVGLLVVIDPFDFIPAPGKGGNDGFTDVGVAVDEKNVCDGIVRHRGAPGHSTGV